MHYYKSSELAEQYGVSRRTVTNWIKQAQKGKVKLELVEEEADSYIAKSDRNQVLIQSIVKERRKYLNTRSHKSIEPLPAFYESFSPSQTHDIIRSLNIHNELPLQYAYFDQGAMLWDEFRTSCGLMDAERLLKASTSYIDWIIEEFEQVNIVDVGVGNGAAARPLIAHLHKMGKLKRYIGIDLSQKMLDITKSNIDEWFNGEIEAEMHVKDVTHETFGDIIAEAPDKKTQEQTTINLVLLLGGHISNFRSPAEVLHVINRSMGAEDLLVSNFKLGAPKVKHQLDFISRYQRQSKVVLDLLGIDESLYTVEIGFSDEDQIRYSRVRLKCAITIEFKLSKGSWFVDVNKDETILTYRAHFNDAFSFPEELFYKNGFHTLMTTQRMDHEGMLLIANLRA